MKIFLKQLVITILTWEAKLVLLRYKPRIIAVTGNVGKTSTKDAIYTALAPLTHVRKSDKSFNSDMGVPLSILGLPNGWQNPLLWLKNIILGLWLIVIKHKYPQWLVLEVGADAPGDISTIAKWLKPDAVVLTRFPDVPVHIEFFESKEQVIAEKTSLAKYMKKDGLLVLNADDPEIIKLKNKFGNHTLTYGYTSNADFFARNIEFVYTSIDGAPRFPVGREWTLVANDTPYIVSMPHIVGDSHITTALAALAVSSGLGFPINALVANIAEYKTPPGRLALLRGEGETLIIDDTYNSSPVAAESALHLLKSIEAPGRKIVVLGDMLELGKFTQPAHKEVGAQIVGVADLLVTVGIRAIEIDAGAFEAGFSKTQIHHFETSEQAGAYLKATIAKGDIVLCKASQGIRLERAVKMIMADSEQAKNLLVRQEKEWLAK